MGINDSKVSCNFLLLRKAGKKIKLKRKIIEHRGGPQSTIRETSMKGRYKKN
jgi:hypothetical protein